MKDMFKKGVALGLGIAATGVEQADKLVDELVKKGEMTREEAKDFVRDYTKKGADTHNDILGEFNVATKEDIKRLESRIDDIAARISQE